MCSGAPSDLLFSIGSGKIDYWLNKDEKVGFSVVISDKKLNNYLTTLNLKEGVYYLEIDGKKFVLEVMEKEFNFW